MEWQSEIKKDKIFILNMINRNSKNAKITAYNFGSD